MKITISIKIIQSTLLHQWIPFDVHLAIKEQFISGNTVTVMSPDGKPIQMNAMALQTAAAQNAAGMLGRAHIDDCMKYFEMRNFRFYPNIF